MCVCVCMYVPDDGFDPSLSELTGLVVRGVKLRVFTKYLKRHLKKAPVRIVRERHL